MEVYARAVRVHKNNLFCMYNNNNIITLHIMYTRYRGRADVYAYRGAYATGGVTPIRWGGGRNCPPIVFM